MRKPHDPTMAPLQRKLLNSNNNDDSPVSLMKKTCPTLSKEKAASSTATQQQHSSNYYRQTCILLLALMSIYFLSNTSNPRNYTLNFSYVEIKPESDKTKALLIDSNYLQNNNKYVKIISDDKSNNVKKPMDKVKSIKDEQSKSKRVKLVKMKDILREGNPLNNIKLWRQYLHYKVYKFGIPKERKVSHFMKHNEACAFDGYKYTPPMLCSHHDKDCSLNIRKNRFPSIEERVKYYMGRWYDNNETVFSEKFYDNFNQDQEDVMDYSRIGRILINPYELDPVKMYKFYAIDWKKYKHRDRTAKNYIRDFIDFSIIYNAIKGTAPVIFHHGDGLSSASERKKLNRSYPVFGKVRDILAENDHVHHWRYPSTKGCRQCGLKHSNIIWPLNRRRHYSAVASVPKNDILFQNKIPMAVWRGRIEKSDLVQADLPIEISSWKQRMALVGNHLNSTHVDAKFPDNTLTDLPSNAYLGSTMQMSDMLKYKYLIAIEGNDVSSGLKWMLFSNSVVFIPHPITWESWAMESLLQPFVHYIPIHANMTNIEG